MCKYTNVTQRKYAALGLCVYCGKIEPEPEKKGCSACLEKRRQHAKKNYTENKERAKEQRQKARRKIAQYRIENGLCRQCGEKAVEDKKYCEPCLSYRVEATRLYNQRHPEKAKEYRQKVRKEVIDKYGGRCDCCQESTIEFLAIDHKNNDGATERRDANGKNVTCTPTWYAKLRREPRREDLRVLCHNCNMAIGFYGNCPHQNVKGQ